MGHWCVYADNAGHITSLIFLNSVNYIRPCGPHVYKLKKQTGIAENQKLRIINFLFPWSHNIIQFHSSVCGTTLFCEIFLTFRLNVRNILHNNVSPTEHYYGPE